MNMRNTIIFGQRYMAVEEVYILDRLSEDSRMTVHDSQNGHIDTRVVITSVDVEGYVYVKIHVCLCGHFDYHGQSYDCPH